MVDMMNRGKLKAATQAAALGRYDAALTLLESDSSDGPETKLLRAKIFAQQGRYGDAINQWQEVLKDSPDNHEALEGIETTQAMRNRNGASGRLYLRSYIYYSILIVISLALAYTTVFFARKAAAANDQRLAMFLEAQKGQQQQVNEVIGALKLTIQEVDKRTSAEIISSRQTIDTLVASLAQSHEETRVSGERTSLSLAALAQQLELLQESIGTYHSNLTSTVNDQFIGLSKRVRKNAEATKFLVEQTSTEICSELFAAESRQNQAHETLRTEIHTVLALSDELANINAHCSRLNRGLFKPNKRELKAIGDKLERLSAKLETLWPHGRQQSPKTF